MPQLIDTGSATRTAASPDVLCFPGDAGYDEARRAWNLAVDQRPAAVALPETVDDVVAAVDYARTVGLRVAVQGTGHGARHDLLDGTLLINTARMTGVEIDASARVATVAAGTIWIDVVDAAVEHGLTALHGSAQDVGVVGYSLGGGIGWLARKHGLSASSVLSAEVVTADGEVVRADAETNPDLFWALRGGGGSFGVVTSVEIALYPLAEAFAGWLIWPMDRAGEVLAAWADWTRTVPEEVTSIGRLLQLPPIPEMPPALRGRQVVVVEAAYLGDEASGRELLRPLLDLQPEIDTFATVPARGLTELHQDPPAPVPAVGRRLDARHARRGGRHGHRRGRRDGRHRAAPLPRDPAPRRCPRATRPRGRRAVALRGVVRAVRGRRPDGPRHARRDRVADRRGAGGVRAVGLAEHLLQLRGRRRRPERPLPERCLRPARGDPRRARPGRPLPRPAHDLVTRWWSGGRRASRPPPPDALAELCPSSERPLKVEVHDGGMDENTNTDERAAALTRRDSLLRLGGLAAGALGATAWKLESADDAAGAGAGPAAVASGLVSCVLAPEQTEGPYYLEGDKVRRNVREGRPGVALNLRTTVVDVSNCKPIRAAAVDIWHCDASGTYSGFAQEGTEGQTFMRGIQRTDRAGLAVFDTIYPGWYQGRTVHIHVQVHLGGDVLHTGQLYELVAQVGELGAHVACRGDSSERLVAQHPLVDPRDQAVEIHGVNS